MNSPRPIVSVIVATFNGKRQLELCLKSLMAQTSGRMEIIIADDGSDSPDTARIIESLKADRPMLVKHARLRKEGFQLSKSRNNAVTHASGEILVFLDHDILVPPCFITTVTALMKEGWFLAGRRVKLDEQTTHEILGGNRTSESLFTWKFAATAWLRKMRGWRYLFPLRDRGPSGEGQSWQGMSGFCIITSAKAFHEVDGFDHTYRHYGAEDRDFLARLNHAGYRGALLPGSCTVAHLWHHEKAPDLAHENYRFLESTLKERRIRALEGYSTLLDQGVPAPIGDV